jgi:hypothetical protein
MDQRSSSGRRTAHPLLSIALLAAVVVLSVAVAAVWQTVLGAEWISRLW